jgi:hypothetical protein
MSGAPSTSVQVSNNAFGTLAASITTVQTVISLTAGQGARFPLLGTGQWFWATLVNAQNTIEVVKVTVTSGDSFTITRGQDGTTAFAYSAGDRIELRPTAALFNDKLGYADAQAIYATQSYVQATYLPLAGGTLSGNLVLESQWPSLQILATGVAAPSGRFAFNIGAQGQLALTRNTAGAGNFSTGTTPIQVGQNDVVSFSQRPSYATGTPWDTGNLPNPGQTTANQTWTGSNVFAQDVYATSGGIRCYGWGGNVGAGVLFMNQAGTAYMFYTGGQWEFTGSNQMSVNGWNVLTTQNMNVSQFNNDAGYTTALSVVAPRYTNTAGVGGVAVCVGIEMASATQIRPVMTYFAMQYPEGD